ncbi:MAG: outer membrane beta-barrel protein [Saprospiraceae bacterium]
MAPSERPGSLGPRLAGHPSPVPPGLNWDHMGAPIRAGLRRERRRRLMLWFASGGLGLLLLLVGTYHYPAADRSLPAVNAPIASVQPVQYGLPDAGVDLGITTLREERITEPDFSDKLSLDQPTVASLSSDRRVLSPANSNPGDDRPETFVIPVAPIATVGAGQNAVPSIITLYPEFLPLDVSLFPKLNTPAVQQTPTPGPRGINFSLSGGANLTEVDAPESLTDFTPRPGYYADLRVTKRFGPPWSVPGGSAYRQLRYRENLEEDRAVRLFRPGTVDTVFVGELTGNETYAFTDTIPGRRETRFQYHNRRNIVTLPLLIGWQTGPENSAADWNLRLRAGLEFTFWEQSSGRTINRNGRIVDLKTQVGQGLQFAGLIEAEAALPVQVAGGQPFIRAALRREFGLLEQANGAAARRLQGGEIGIGWRFTW